MLEPPKTATPPASSGSESERHAHCLSDDEVVEIGQGQASRALLVRIDSHLDQCPSCRELVAAVLQAQQEGQGPSSQVTTFYKGSLLAGRYRVERFLGKGGMGEVYAARDELTQQRVAIKTVLCTAADNPRAIRKLLGEVAHAQRVAHPHVFKIYDLHEHVERQGRIPFFTMELIEGESLGKLLRASGPLSLEDAQTISRQLLSGLSAAHEEGVLHLDFKSDNVLLRKEEAPPNAVIMDFGLSRASDVATVQASTSGGHGAGTLAYMALEQLECRNDVGAPADIYAFGVVLYEMLTGCLPFRGASVGAMLMKQVNQRPLPPSQHRAGLAPTVDAFVLKCLERESSRRYATAEQALLALGTLGPWSAQRGRPRSRLWMLAVLALLALSISGWRVGTASVLEGHAITLPQSAHAALQSAAVAAVRQANPAERAAAAGTTAPVIALPPSKAQPRATARPRHAASRPRRAGVAPAPSEPAAQSAGPTPALTPTQGWRGPPPRSVPRPAPL